MKILIDLQGAQTESRFRGIGQYTLEFTKAILRNSGNNEVYVLLNGLLDESIRFIKTELINYLPSENILVWYSEGPVFESDPNNIERRKAAEVTREDFIDRVCPDILHISSLFEGYIDDAVTSVNKKNNHYLTSAMIYDLIPLLNRDVYLTPSPLYEEYYLRKLGYYNNIDFLFAISEFTKQEALDNLDFDKSNVINISTAISDKFKVVRISDEDRLNTLANFGISKPFIMYSGGGDQRKNLPRLLEAYAQLPLNLKNSYQLVFVGKMPADYNAYLKGLAKDLGIQEDDFVITGFVSDKSLVDLYNICELFVFPSWHEGFGIPALEAMACGAPVIGANTASLPEVIGMNDALFDPFDTASISNKIKEVLEDPEIKSCLVSHGYIQCQKFSWDKVAVEALATWMSKANTVRGI